MKKYSPAITTDFILVDILEELREINKKLGSVQLGEGEIESFEELVEKVKPKAICKTCGNVHEHAWQYGVCSRKNNKKE